MTNYNIVATSELIARELRRFIIWSMRRSGVRYTQTGLTFNVTIEGWPQVFLDRWRNFILDRWGV